MVVSAGRPGGSLRVKQSWPSMCNHSGYVWVWQHLSAMRGALLRYQQLIGCHSLGFFFFSFRSFISSEIKGMGLNSLFSSLGFPSTPVFLPIDSFPPPSLTTCLSSPVLVPCRTFWVRLSARSVRSSDHQPADWKNHWGEWKCRIPQCLHTFLCKEKSRKMASCQIFCGLMFLLWWFCVCIYTDIYVYKRWLNWDKLSPGMKDGGKKVETEADETH